MPFQTRNPYYLRISEKNVMPLYLYLDERHLEWMSDLVLQHVLADLRPHILPKLKTEMNLGTGASSNNKKSTLDTHRGETYQFCYFFRKTEPHSLVVKTRTYVARPPKKQPTMPPPPVPSSSKPQRGKRKSKPTPEKGSTQNSRKKRKTKGKGRDRDQDDELSTCSDEDLDDDYNPSETRRSKGRAEPPTEEYQEVDEYGDPADDTIRASTTQTDDVDMADSTPSRDVPPSTMAFEFEITEEEEKPKPILQLKYQGFNIYGHCLCVVVEPWPQVRSMSRALSVATVLNREPRIAPPRSVAAREPGARAKTPLFLPDDYDRERSETPAPFRAQSVPEGSIFDPSFLEDSDDSDDNGGMMLFSQVLNNAGDARAGAADDDEDMDTDMFFGDADEMREL